MNTPEPKKIDGLASFLQTKTGPNAKQQKVPNELGSVIVFIVLLCLLLFILAGLAIDSSILSTSKAQQRHSAEYISLAALKSYIESSASTKEQKLDAAIKRAREVAGSNLMLARPFQEKKTSGNTLGSNVTAHDDDNGSITPGIWHFSAGTSACGGVTCPCDPSGAWATPCFQKISSLSDPASDDINSFRVTFKTAGDSPIRAAFTQFLGTKSQSLESTATAALIPKHIVFLMDVSRSSQWETHLPLEMTRGNSPAPEVFSIREQMSGAGGINTFEASESSFQIAKVNPSSPTECAGPTDHTNNCTYFAGYPPTYKCLFDGVPYSNGVSPDPSRNTSNLFDTVYNEWRAQKAVGFGPIMEVVPPPGNPRIDRPTKHYRLLDYQCFIVNSFTEELPDGSTDTTSDQHFLVDTRNTLSSGDSYQGAEPLSTMLNGVNHGLKLLRDRKIPGDRAGFIAFDRSATIDIRRTVTLLPPSDSKIADLILATDTSDTSIANLRRRYQEFFLMPRAALGLNIPEALTEAKEMLLPATPLTPPLPTMAHRTVVMLSDGLSNCVEDSSSGTTERFCLDRLSDVKASLAKAHDILISEYATNDIRFDFIMIGDHAAPHTLIRLDKKSGNEAKCMSEADARLQESQVGMTDASSYGALTESQAFGNFRRGSSFFYAANTLYEAIVATKGMWLPIRPCYTGAGTTCKNIQGYLDDECKAKSTSLNHGDLVTDSTYGDVDGRLPFDPSGRSKRQQVEDAIDQVFSRSSYILVD